MNETTTQPALAIRFSWGARCDCRNNHSSASGRCNARNVKDPTRRESDNFVACESCRASCPCGNGVVVSEGLENLLEKYMEGGAQ